MAAPAVTAAADACLATLEANVEEIIKSFMVDPNYPVTHASCLTVREVLVAIESLLGMGLNPAAAALGAGACEEDQGSNIPEPLWWALKQTRISTQDGEVGEKLLHILQEVVPQREIPPICPEYGWGRARLLLQECLNEHCLSRLVDGFLLDCALRERVYDGGSTLIAPMRVAVVRDRLRLQVAALNGVDFALVHWASLLLPFSIHTHTHTYASLHIDAGARQNTSTTSSIATQYDQVRLHLGTLSPIGFLLQATPLRSITIPARQSYEKTISLLLPSPPAMPERGCIDGTAAVVVAWQFEVAYHDIGFKVVHVLPQEEEEGEEEQEVVTVQPWGRIPAKGHPMEGSFRTHTHTHQEAGQLVFTFDNTYSLGRSKDVNVRVAVVPLEAFKAAELSAKEAITAAIWRAVATPGASGCGGNDGMDQLQSTTTPAATATKHFFGSPPRVSRDSSYDDLPPPSAHHHHQYQSFSTTTTTGISDAVLSSLVWSSSSSSSSLSLSYSSSPRSSIGVDGGGGGNRGSGKFWSCLLNTATEALASSSSFPSSLPSTPSSLVSSSSRFSSSSSSSFASLCDMCTESFGLFRRPHRCRRCSGMFCLPCSRHFILLETNNNNNNNNNNFRRRNKPQRVCDRCFVQVKDHGSEQQEPDQQLVLSSSSSSLSSSFSLGDTKVPAAEGEEEGAAGTTTRRTRVSNSAKPDVGLSLERSNSNGSADGGEAPGAAYEALKLKPEMERFFKMLSVGVPAVALSHKMANEGIKEEWIRIFVAGKKGAVAPGAAAGTGGDTAVPANKAVTETATAAATTTTTTTAQQSRPSSLRRSSSSSSSSSSSPYKPSPVTATASFKLRPVHFEQLTPERAEKSIFKAGRKSGVHLHAHTHTHTPLLQGQHAKELAELFSVTPIVPPQRGSSSSSSDKAGTTGGRRRGPSFGAALDARRLQNVGIVYSYFKKSFASTEELLLTILRLQSQDKDRLPAERLPGLLEILPSPEEAKKLMLAVGCTSNSDLVRAAVPLPSPSSAAPLHEVEAFMVASLRIPRMTAKVRGYHFWLSFQESSRTLDSKMDSLGRAFGDVMRSERLVRVLEVLLYIGNTMNAYSKSSNAGVVAETFTIDSLFRLALTKSTTSGSDVTLLDYFVRLAAEKGEGAILNVAEDMPTLQLASSLPDCSAVLRDVRLWLQDFAALKHELGQETQDLASYDQQRLARKETQQRAIEEEQAAIKAKQEAARRRQEEELRKSAARQETLRALIERLAMEKEDLAPQQMGEHFVRFLGEAEQLVAGHDARLWANILAVLHLSGPPVPPELKMGLLVRRQQQQQRRQRERERVVMAATAVREQQQQQQQRQQQQEEEEEEDGFFDAQQEEEVKVEEQEEEDENEDEEEAIKRLNDELGSCQGDDVTEQALLHAASCWLGSRLKVAKALEDLRQDQPPLTVTSTPSTSAPVQGPGEGRGGGGLGGLGGLGGGRGALLAALRGGGGGGGGGGGRGGGRGRGRGGRGQGRGGQQDKEKDHDLRVLYEPERAAFLQGLQTFIATVEARVEEVSKQCTALDKQARELYEYFGEDPANASSARILSTLWKFLQRLGFAKGQYERRHGKIMTLEDMVEEGEEEEEEGGGDKGVEGGEEHHRRRSRRRSSLPPMVIGQPLATIFGPGILEAVRVKDRTHVVRFVGNGCGWHATGYLKAGALIGKDMHVSTPFGCGVVVDVQRQVGMYQVELLAWGSDEGGGVMLYTPYVNIKAVVSRKEEQGERERDCK